MTDEKIKRINELSKQSKIRKLTKEEKEEQAKLRREYIDAVKGDLKKSLDNISIE